MFFTVFIVFFRASKKGLKKCFSDERLMTFMYKCYMIDKQINKEKYE